MQREPATETSRNYDIQKKNRLAACSVWAGLFMSYGLHNIAAILLCELSLPVCLAIHLLSYGRRSTNNGATAAQKNRKKETIFHAKARGRKSTVEHYHIILWGFIAATSWIVSN